MARTFVSGSSTKAVAGSAVVSGSPCTLACWFKPSNTAGGTDKTLMSVDNGATASHLLMLRSAGSNGAATAQAQTGGSSSAASAGNPTNGVWAHMGAVFASTTSRTAYTNGTPGTTDTTSVSAPTLTETKIGVLWVTTQYADGDIAEAAIWNVALSAADMAALAQGLSPLMVRPGALVSYWPLMAGYSPEIDLVSRVDLTLTNAPALATHTRVFSTGRRLRTAATRGAALIAAVSSFAFSSAVSLLTTATMAAQTAFAFATTTFDLTALSPISAYFIQAGTSCYWMTPYGVVTQITPPSGTTLYGTAAQACRTTLFQIGDTPLAVVVNGGTRDFYLDTVGTARPLAITAPTTAPVPVAGAGSDLTGVYRVAVTFKVKDATTGQTLFESGMGPLSASVSLTTKTIALSVIPVSGDASVNARGVYRTLAGGTTLYPWFDIDNNTTLIEDRGIADASLSLLPTTAVRNGAPPLLKLIASWKNRLWGVPRNRPDFLRWTEDRLLYGWSADNEVLVPPQASDPTGCTALIPRRDDLGVGKRKSLHTIRGNSNQSFQRIGISETLGPVNQESVVVIYNTAYFLTDVGVAEWTDNGVGLISEALVDAWFTSDTYFNRSMFPYAQARYNPDTDAYELLLASAGSTTLDRWVAFDLQKRTWLGPHKTDAFVLSCTGNGPTLRGGLTDGQGKARTVFGGADGYLYARDTQNVMDHTTAVPFRVTLPVLTGGDPTVEKFWDRFTVHTRVETGGELVITPTVGDIGTPASAPHVHPLTLGERTLGRLGRGRLAQFLLTHSSTTERPRIFGIEIPFNILGRRK